MASRPLWLAALVLTGCAAVGPDYRTPEIETPDTFGDGDAQRLDAEQLSTWWSCFGDEQLSGLVEQVLTSNLDLGAALESVEFARATYGIVSADRFPTLDATGSYSRARILGMNATGDQWTLGGRASWEVDLFGRVRRSVEASLSSFEADVEDLRAVRVALVAETVATYLQVLSLGERLGIAARNTEGQRQSLGIAQQRFDAGMAAGLDPAQARVNLFSSESSVPLLELQLRTSLHRLAVLTGQDPRALLESLQTERALPGLPDELMVGIPADLLRNRPDVRRLERLLAAQTAQVGVATAARYPAINLSGSWDWLSSSLDGLFDNATETGSVGPVVSLPIFNAGRIRSRIEAEEAALRQLDLSLRQRVLTAQEEVENALVAVVRDRARADLLEDAAQAAGRSVHLSRQLYTSGQSDFQNVLDAERSLFALEDDLARARLTTLLDIVDLYRALGGGWGAGSVENEAP